MNQEKAPSLAVGLFYSPFDQKQVTTWLDLRNSAAHGKYSEYDIKQVQQFTEWLSDLIIRKPA